MALADLIPSYFTQVFASGDGVTGVAYTGTATVVRQSSDYPARDGRIYVQGKGGGDGVIDGGLFPIGTLRPRLWNRYQGAFIKLPGCTAISVYAVDEDNVEYLLETVSTDTLVHDGYQSRWLLPGWNLKVVATGTLSGAGKINLIFDEWADPISFAPLA